MVREMGFTELPVSVSHGQRAGMLPGSHKDPFDRMLIAQALAEDLPIVSGDKSSTNTTCAVSGENNPPRGHYVPCDSASH
jgi:PIN domain nuclease of toxin-antitoxin system